jgi:ADP-heptose:LPS heptosyltransferase
VILTGGPGERELLQQIVAQLDPAPRTLAGETTLGQLAALFAGCELVIGGDSGPLHLAAAVGTRTVRLYGPTDITEFGPWPRDDRQIALTAGLPCQPCRNLIAPPCGAVELPACLRAISVDSVLQAVTNAVPRLLTVPDSEAPHPPTPAPARGSGGASADDGGNLC